MHTDYAERARALVGTRFRPQGRNAEGLDCIGVAITTFGVPEESVRRNYRLRGDHGAEITEFLPKYFRRVSRSQLRPGDLMVLAVAADQLHLAISTDNGFVHADAGLRRVVETPGPPGWPVIAIFRRGRK